MSMMHHLYHSCNSITLTVHSHTTHTHAYLGGQYSTLPLEHASMAQAWTNHDPSSCYIKLIDSEVAVIAPPKSSRGAKKFFQNIFVIIICQALALTPTKNLPSAGSQTTLLPPNNLPSSGSHYYKSSTYDTRGTQHSGNSSKH